MRTARSKTLLREQATVASAKIAAAFELLRNDAPAAAYLFARTLVNARPLLKDDTRSRVEKIVLLQKEIENARGLSAADAGLSMLGMEFHADSPRSRRT
jgi:hypothetical protein